MILFFQCKNNQIISTETKRQLNQNEINKLLWLYGNAKLIDKIQVDGFYIGPRREMITPWSTNAVEITQNMGLNGISRIEKYIPTEHDGENPDPMIYRNYNGLNQEIFTIKHTPEPIKIIDDIEKFNNEEGLALSKEEIQYLHTIEKANNRPLTDSEIFGFAQINSEHCRHKIFSGEFIIDGEPMESSLFNMIKKTTKEHQGKIVSAYKDNVAFAKGPNIEQFAPLNQIRSDYFHIKPVDSVISLKAETHNFPTTVEPFNGAATGTGGEIRDRMAGGVGSCPIAGTAVYMTAYTRLTDERKKREDNLPERNWLYQTPQQILTKASNGASDFGNKFGQPLICGSVLTFEHQENNEKYAYDKVIMLAGGVGYGTQRDCLKKKATKGNKIVVIGGDNYRIGLGGGSVSSVDTGKYSNGIELNAIQRANPEMQKRAYNLIRALAESNNNPIISIHDHGSAGHLNCLSELVEECGGEVEIEKLPIGDKTLSAKEIIANESQERMGILIDQKYIDDVKSIAERERTPFYVVGETTGNAHFDFIQKDGKKPFDLDISQMFGHSPKTVMIDQNVKRTYKEAIYDIQNIDEYLKLVLQLEAVACKDWLTNKVDRSVTGKVALQQCQGKLQLPLADCAIVALDYRGCKGIATAIGHAPQAGLISPEAGSILSVAESLTNLVFAPLENSINNISLSANWMWPCRSQKGEDARLYNAVKALSDFCCAIGVNVPTGKDSLSLTQQYPNGEKIISPGTVIVSSVAEVSDIKLSVSPVLDNKNDTEIYYIDFSFDEQKLGGSAFEQSLGKIGTDAPSVKDTEYFCNCFNTIQELVKNKKIIAGHDISAGGLITTLLEMAFANTEGGIEIDLSEINGYDTIKKLFSENPGIVLQIKKEDSEYVTNLLDKNGICYLNIGKPINKRQLIITDHNWQHTINIDEMRDYWYETSYLLNEKQTYKNLALDRKKNYKKQPIEMIFNNDFKGSFKEYGINPNRWKEENKITYKTPKAAIIREKGTNGDREMAYCLYLAGFEVKDITMYDLISGHEDLKDINMIVFCGGFSNSDVLGSAKGWAGSFLFNSKAKETLDNFYARKDTLSLGICNGCQLMVELNLIGYSADSHPSLVQNDSKKFESNFLTVTIPKNNSVMLNSLSGNKLGIWVAHGEGKFILPKEEKEYNIIAKYSYKDYPGNPNGSDYSIAGLCSKDGRHLAMMPHLERSIFPWQNAWYPKDRKEQEVTPWIEAFVNARKWIEKHI